MSKRSIRFKLSKTEAGLVEDDTTLFVLLFQCDKSGKRGHHFIKALDLSPFFSFSIDFSNEVY